MPCSGRSAPGSVPLPMADADGGRDLRLRAGVRRGEPVTFRFDDRALLGCAGESLAAALWAAGVYGSAEDPAFRTLFCAMGICQQCTVWVDGRRVEACRVPVRSGMAVHTVMPAGDA